MTVGSHGSKARTAPGLRGVPLLVEDPRPGDVPRALVWPGLGQGALGFLQAEHRLAVRVRSETSAGLMAWSAPLLMGV